MQLLTGRTFHNVHVSVCITGENLCTKRHMLSSDVALNIPIALTGKESFLTAVMFLFQLPLYKQVKSHTSHKSVTHTTEDIKFSTASVTSTLQLRASAMLLSAADCRTTDGVIILRIFLKFDQLFQLKRENKQTDRQTDRQKVS